MSSYHLQSSSCPVPTSIPNSPPFSDIAGTCYEASHQYQTPGPQSRLPQTNGTARRYGALQRAPTPPVRSPQPRRIGRKRLRPLQQLPPGCLLSSHQDPHLANHQRRSRSDRLCHGPHPHFRIGEHPPLLR
jgi:hypothetical protein